MFLTGRTKLKTLLTAALLLATMSFNSVAGEPYIPKFTATLWGLDLEVREAYSFAKIMPFWYNATYAVANPQLRISGVPDLMPVYGNDILTRRENVIRQTVRRDSSYYYLICPELPGDWIEPYNLYTMLHGRDHGLMQMSEGYKYKFRIYTLMEAGYTNLATRPCVYEYGKDRLAEVCPRPIPLKNVKKPTEEEWKEMNMHCLFTFLFEQTVVKGRK